MSRAELRVHIYGYTGTHNMVMLSVRLASKEPFDRTVDATVIPCIMATLHGLMSTTKPTYTCKIEELEEETQLGEGRSEVGERSDYTVCQFIFFLYIEPCFADVEVDTNR